MTRFVAALLVAAGRTAQADLRTAATGIPGTVRECVMPARVPEEDPK